MSNRKIEEAADVAMHFLGVRTLDGRPYQQHGWELELEDGRRVVVYDNDQIEEAP